MGFRRALQRNFSASAIRSPGCRDPSPPEKVQQNRLGLASDESSGHSTQRRWVFAALSKETSSLGLLVSVESSGHSTNGDGFSPRSPKKLLRVNCAGFATDPPRPGKVQQNLTIQVVYLNLLPEGVDLMIEVFELF